MIQNTQFLQLSMLKINNVYWSNEIANYIILFNLVKPKINEVFILSYEKLKKHFVDLLNLMSRKTKSKKLQHLNYQVDTWKFQNYFYKFNGFESTLIFKVQTHILFVKASFTSKKMFSAKCSLCSLKFDTQKDLMICKTMHIIWWILKHFTSCPINLHIVFISAVNFFMKKKDRKSETKPAFCLFHFRIFIAVSKTSFLCFTWSYVDFELIDVCSGKGEYILWVYIHAYEYIDIYILIYMVI